MNLLVCQDFQGLNYSNLMSNYMAVGREKGVLVDSLRRASRFRPSLRDNSQKARKIQPSYCTGKGRKFMKFQGWKRKLITLVNGPANLQSPPNPQDCKKWSGCCEASSDANIFWIILCTAARTTWSFDDDNTLLIFWSRSEWLEENSSNMTESFEIYFLTWPEKL